MYKRQAEGRLTAWSDNAAEDDAPERFALLGGVRLATTFWKTSPTGHRFELSPFAEFRADLVLEETDGVPVTYDAVEDSLEGQFTELGLRGRWAPPEGRTSLDVELRGTHAEDVAEGEESGWLPTALFGTLRTEIGGVPVEAFQDLRYDVDDRETVYSLSSLGIDPTEDLRIVVGHNRGLDADREPLFESALVGARYTWSPKWEFEARHRFPILARGEESTQGTIRRFGHDFVLEIEFEDRSGEGGSSVSFNLRPTLGWSPSRLSRLGLEGD